MADLGVNKAVITARQVVEIDPFAEVEAHPRGLTTGGEEAFLASPERADVLVEEMDDLQLKIDIRRAAHRLGIPVVMVTGNDNDVIVDVERYDQEPELPILNGYLTQEVIDAVERLGPRAKTLEDRIALARDFIGADYLAPRLVDSFPRVGRTLAGIPQLATSSFMRGAAISYVVRQIVTGVDMPSGRYAFCIGDLLDHRV
jgi:hypothetical protein